jgi:hypothetical protein
VPSKVVESKQKPKVRIPGKHVYDEPMFVNVKQAKRMLVMREKRAKKFLKAHVEAQGTSNDLTTNKTFGRFTKIRVKD